MQFLTTLLQPLPAEPDERKQYIYVANILSLLFAGLALILTFILYLIFGYIQTLPVIGVAVLLFIGVIVLNKTGRSGAGRLLFCLTPIWMTLFVSLWGKAVQPEHSYMVYFDSRFVLLITTVLPAIVFDLNERVKIIASLVSTFICLIFFDPIHNLFGLGYYQRGFEMSSYYYINYVVFISFVGLLSAIFILKWRDQHVSRQRQDLLTAIQHSNAELMNNNKKLAVISQEMEAQNEEMQQQQEELQTSYEMLENANRLISEQRSKLQVYNTELERLVKEKSTDLVKTNEELIKSNNELRQFSFTVSHNLRGPVARLLGLTNLIRYSENPEEIAQLTAYIHDSAGELDSILKDLAQIIDIRNDLYRVRERIALQDEWNRALSLVGISAVDGTLTATFEQSPYVFAIRPMVQSILYNLISNAVKYKSPDRKLQITARSYAPSLNETVIEIRDNGLGMDLSTQREDLFKLYKRFHHHVPGKGLGLYLVKSQMEIMGGYVEVESEPDKGALFKLHFPFPADVDKQVFFENDAAQLYYDANVNNTVIIWKRGITSVEYRKTFEVVLQTIKTYNTPGWIADLRNQGTVEASDQQWFIDTVLKAAHRNGLKRIGAVGFTDPVRKDYYERMKNVSAELGIDLRVFNSVEAAVAWMKQFVT
ncbi:MAG: sensor histidine kinase [Cyclobacteriaceae bacterium]